MNNETQSPTPWKVVPMDYGWCKIVDARGGVVAGELFADTAAQIVAAVNSVGPMREALETDSRALTSFLDENKRQDALVKIDAALALAQTEEKK
jgi:hypothetical protein